jgi:hypothetical protein
MRDRWLDAVLRADAEDLTNAVKLVCVALSLRMDDSGRVTANRQDVAAALGWATKQRVSDRIKEARDAEFLSILRGGKNGQPVTYDAMIPAKYRQLGTPSRGTPGNGWRGTSDGVPAPAQDEATRYPATGYQYARVTPQNHNNGAPSAAQRGSREHDGNDTGAVTPSWQSTPSKRPSSDSTERVA